MKLNAYERALLIYLPALVLLVAFIAVCVQAGTPWPWNRVVHEDGQHTFLGTIFYFEHATRELLLDAALALAAAGAVRYFYPPARTGGDHELARMRILLGVAVAAALALILGGTAYRQRVRAVLLHMRRAVRRSSTISHNIRHGQGRRSSGARIGATT